MITIAIVDNDALVQKALESQLNEYAKRRKLVLRICCFSDGLTLLEGGTAGFDLIMLDIDMPLLDGMATARAIRQNDQQVLIIFVTRFSRYAIQGYQVRAFDYVIKPVTDNTLTLTMDRAIANLPIRDQGLFINTTNGRVRTYYNRIHYVEVSNHYLRYHTSDGILVARDTMQHAEETLRKHGFSRPCNSFLVNLAHVSTVRGNSVMVYQAEISIGRSRKNSFLNDLSIFLGGA